MARTLTSSARPLIAFLLIASFGILFVGCAKTGDIPQADEFSFTVDDLAKVKELVSTGTGATVPRLELPLAEDSDDTPPVINVAEVEKYTAIRAGTTGDQDLYRVTNAFLNVRSAPNVTASQLGRLERSDTVEVLEFVDAAWAKIAYEGAEGYVSARYVSKLVSEEQLTEEKKKYEGLYFVDFGFLNVRKEPDANSDKIGELPGQAFVRPFTMDEVWARVPFAEGDGYIAVQYLTPFLPNFLVRQSTFHLPVVHFRLDKQEILDAMPQQIAALKEAGYTLWTMQDFYNLLLAQEERDVRLDDKVVILAVSGITPENVREVSDILRVSNVSATLFLSTGTIGEGAIDRQEVSTLLANGFDIQSAAHTGDDLRSLTNAQVELELSQSKKMLEELTGNKVFAVAYPLGGVNDRVARKAMEIGYLIGVSNAESTTFDRSQLLRMPSTIVRASETPDELLAEISK